jgi:D-glycero-alpha-D-manno-heptose 1-phosphate guanylyltransferase
MANEAIILAGGLGKRLKHLTKKIPKPIVLVRNRPFLVYILNYLINRGIDKVILSVGYKGDYIKQYFGDSYKSLRIIYSIEHEPLGTGGAIKKALEHVENDNVFILNGDSFFEIKLESLSDFHFKNNADLSVALKLMDNDPAYGSVQTDKNNKITKFWEKGYHDLGYINGGIYVLRKKLFKSLKTEYPFSIEYDVLEKYFEKYMFYGKPFNEQFIDIGTPKRLAKINSPNGIFLDKYK